LWFSIFHVEHVTCQRKVLHFLHLEFFVIKMALGLIAGSSRIFALTSITDCKNNYGRTKNSLKRIAHTANTAISVCVCVWVSELSKFPQPCLHPCNPGISISVSFAQECRPCMEIYQRLCLEGTLPVFQLECLL